MTVADALDGRKKLEILLFKAGAMLSDACFFLYMRNCCKGFLKKNIPGKNAEVGDQQQPANDLQKGNIFFHHHYYRYQNCGMPASQASCFYQLSYSIYQLV